MLKPEYTKQFKKDLKTMQKRKANMNLLKEVIEVLCNEQPLAEKYKNHFLSNNWSGCQECHIKPDWLLIYQVGNGIIVFERTGSHSDFRF